jgi:hypothetical protein
MKFTSLVLTALVAATQFSSTWAAGSVEATDDKVSTAASTAIKIAVLANDLLDNDSGSPVQATKDNVDISDITLTTSPASGSAAPTKNSDGTLTYTPFLVSQAMKPLLTKSLPVTIVQIRIRQSSR